MQIYLPIAEMSANIMTLIGMGGLVGFMSGMFGVGGGFLMTPLLIFIGIPPAVAVASEANQIVASSVSGGLAHWRRRAVDIRMGLILMSGGVAGSYAGVQLFKLLRALGQVDLLISSSYVIFLSVIGALMLRESLHAIRETRKGRPIRVRRPGNIAGFCGCPCVCAFVSRGSISALFRLCSSAFWWACCRPLWASGAALLWFRR